MLFLFASLLSAQVEYSSDHNSLANTNGFFVDYAGYKSEIPNKTRIDIFVQVPYQIISFIKKEERFNGGFSVTVTFWDEKKNNVILERNWKEKVSTDEFSQTTSSSNFYITYKSFDMAPGKYFVKCIVEDSDSRRISAREFLLNSRDISASPGLSDLMLISKTVENAEGERIIPNISGSVTSKQTSLSFFFEIYSASKEDIVVEYILNDLNKNVSLKQEDPRSIPAGVNSISHTIKETKFSSGNYSLTVSIKDSSRKEIAAATKNFVARIDGVPTSIADLDKAIAQMMYIASPSELSYIKDPKDIQERMDRFMAFWDKKKPNPKIEENPILNEYYRRVEYANKNFKGFGEGWRSDMGMVFITFGPPSYVERHPIEMDSKPYEIWQYNELNRQFVFLDQTGFGDYHLVDPDFSRWPGYRQ